MAVLRLFAAAREAAGRGRDTFGGPTVGAVLAEASARYGDRFAQVLAASRVWVNGEPAGDEAAVGDDDEVAVLPPVSGGMGGSPTPTRGPDSDSDPGPGGPTPAPTPTPAPGPGGPAPTPPGCVPTPPRPEGRG
ncbi:MAG: MoaD/ThiS family protein [Acidimicrobiales bacterium]